MRIKTKIFLVILTITIIMTVCRITVVVFFSAASLKKQSNHHLLTTAQSRANHIRSFLEEQRGKVELIAKNTHLDDLLSKNKKDIDYDAEFNHFQSELLGGLHKEFYEILVLDAKGKIVVSTNNNVIGVDKSTDSYFINAQKRTYI